MIRGILLQLIFGICFCYQASAQLNTLTNPKTIRVKCGLNETKVDSAINLTCDFFTDSIIKIYFESPEPLQKIQVVYMAAGKEPVSAWFNVDVDTRAAVFSPRSTLSQAFCGPGAFMIYYHKNNINLQHYIINLDL